MTKLVAACLALIALAACGGQATTPPPPTPASSAPAATAGSSTWSDVLAAAKKEGAVTVSGPPQDAERGVIMGFAQAFPDIKLQYYPLQEPEFIARAQSERAANTFTFDLTIGGAGSRYAYIQKGWFAPLQSALVLPEVTDDANWLGGVDAGFLDIAKKYVFGFTSYVGNDIKINRTTIPETQLNSAAGLLDPQWKGKIVAFDPRQAGPGLLTFALLRKEMGDDAVRQLLSNQQLVFSTDKRQFTEWVVRARYPIGLGVSDGYLAPFWDQGLGKDVKGLPTKLLHVTPGSGGLTLVDRGPHPNATKVFVNWLLSRDTQATWAKTVATNSRRTDVPPGSPETKPDQA
ncbi:MAG TPA: extracellular solute-binding protein, partial [Chloroflexota bacterium]|nr:extracellular solute-binding protein [Chloroflexota bacterium]